MTFFEAGRRAMREGLARLGRGTEPAAPGRDGPRIAVIGNCQARGIARSLDILAPTARVDLIPMGRLGKDQRSLKAFADRLREHDHVFSQPFPAGFFPDGGTEELAGLLPRLRLFPAVVFPAFHPDLVYVGDLASMADSRLVPSPLHTYHSAIALFGHLRGLSPERIVALFREEVFSTLGYLITWPLAADDLVASSRAIGFDLALELTRWSRRGAFMHSINHPKLFVLADIAARLLREAGIVPACVPVEAYLVDDLLDDAIWPIYPPVAELYGLRGSYVFKRRGKPGAAPSILDLEGFVAESLAIYRKTPRERLTCHRVEHWAGVPEVRALFGAA